MSTETKDSGKDKSYPTLCIACPDITPEICLEISENQTFALCEIDSHRQHLIQQGLTDAKILIADPTGSQSGVNAKYPSLRITIFKNKILSILLSYPRSDGSETSICFPIKDLPDNKESVSAIMSALRTPGLNGSDLKWRSKEDESRCDIFGKRPMTMFLAIVRTNEDGDVDLVTPVSMNAITNLTPESENWTKLFPKTVSSMQEAQEKQAEISEIISALNESNPSNSYYQMALSNGIFTG